MPIETTARSNVAIVQLQIKRRKRVPGT